MHNIHFKLATSEDMEELTSVSMKSFHTDIFAGADTLKGPPGYNSIEFHEDMLRESSFFYKIIDGEKIIGGFWFNQSDHDMAYLYRIFVDPEYHEKGIGLESFSFLFKSFPNIKHWSLKTPVWNTRTPKFYNKIGFEITEKTDKFLYFNLDIKANMPK